MKKLFVTGLALLAAGLVAASFAACSNSSSGSSSNDGAAYTPSSGGSGSATPSVAYTGSMTVNNTAYTSLTMTGDANSGTAVLSGGAGSVSGTYAKATTVAAAANTPNLSGKYTLTFGFGTVSMAVNNDVVLVSAGSAAASGSGLVKQEGDEAPLTTLKGKTFVCPLYTTTDHHEPESGTDKNQIYTCTDAYYITGTSDSEATIYYLGLFVLNDGTPYSSESFYNKNITYSINGTTITFNNDGIQSTATITGSRSFTLAGTTGAEPAIGSTANILGPSSSGSRFSSRITSDQVFIQGNAPSTGSRVLTTEYYDGSVYYSQEKTTYHPDGTMERISDGY
ncbi:MAG: hypothetical protein K6G18_15385 [Treponema sp.]|nr:hypothetical protein [Treponema sp.]